VVKYGVGGNVSPRTNLKAIAVRSSVTLTDKRSAKEEMGIPCAVDNMTANHTMQIQIGEEEEEKSRFSN